LDRGGRLLRPAAALTATRGRETVDQLAPTFGEQLRQLRRERGLSLRQFERTTHHSKSVVWEWENERKVPTAEVVARLDELLDADGALAAAAAHFTPTTADNVGTSEAARLYPHQGSVAEEIRRRATVAEQLDVLAVRGLGIIGLNDSLLRPALMRRKEALRVRVLLLDPDCEAATLRAAEIRESAAAFGAGIRLAVARLEEFAETAANLDLELRLYDRLPVWRIIRIDRLAWVSCFDARWEGHESTVYEIPQTPGGSLWAGYRRQFEDVHAHSRRVI
jgi:transcriptional regulator with XRE-family HTH domain